jgi:hypothetical protein
MHNLAEGSQTSQIFFLQHLLHVRKDQGLIGVLHCLIRFAKPRRPAVQKKSLQDSDPAGMNIKPMFKERIG